uniref:Treacle ribosome biosis factor 1 n=1 Tax=Crocodylus porosus TaxID=8502 RepID=A0A7M4F1H5_CROPO
PLRLNPPGSPGRNGPAWKPRGAGRKNYPPHKAAPPEEAGGGAGKGRHAGRGRHGRGGPGRGGTRVPRSPGPQCVGWIVGRTFSPGGRRSAGSGSPAPCRSLRPRRCFQSLGRDDGVVQSAQDQPHDPPGALPALLASELGALHCTGFDCAAFHPPARPRGQPAASRGHGFQPGDRSQQLLACAPVTAPWRGGRAVAASAIPATSPKEFPSLPTSLEEIFTHWKKAPPNTKKRKAADGAGAVLEKKIRVPDPASSSESSEEEEGTAVKTEEAATLVIPNSAVKTQSSEDASSSSDDSAVAGRGIEVKTALAGGKATNSVQHATPNKASAPSSRPRPAATGRSKANKLKADVPAVASTPAKAGRKKAAPGKPGPAAATQARGAQSKAAATAKAAESSETSDSSESEDKEEKPGAKLPAPKIELKPTAAEVKSSEDSSDETSSEEEHNPPAALAKPAVKAAQTNATLTKSTPITLASTAKSPGKGSALSLQKPTAVAASQAKSASVKLTSPAQAAVSAKPEDTSESSDSSDSEHEEPTSLVQAKPAVKAAQTNATPTKSTPVTPVSTTRSPGKGSALSLRKPAASQARSAPAQLTSPAQAAGSAKSDDTLESSDSSDSEDEKPASTAQAKPAVKAAQTNATPTKSTPVTPVSTTRSPGKGSALSLRKPAASQAKSAPAQLTSPAQAAGSAKSDDALESSDSSDSEDEKPASAAQAKSPAKSLQPSLTLAKSASVALLSSKTTPALAKQTPKPAVLEQAKPVPGKNNTPTKAAVSTKPQDSSESSDDSDSEDEAPPVPISQKAGGVKRLPAPLTSPSKLSQTAKARTPVGAPGSTLKGKGSESESSGSSHSEVEETPAALKQPLKGIMKTGVAALPASSKKAQPPATPLPKAQGAAESSDDSSEESDSEEDALTLAQKLVQAKPKPAAAVPAAKTANTVAVKASTLRKGANAAAPSPVKAAVTLYQAAETSSSGSSESEEDVKAVSQPLLPSSLKSGTPFDKAKPSPADPPGANKGKESSDSSDSSESEEEETAQPPPKPAGAPQKPGRINEAESSSSESSEDEEQPSQSLLAGYPGLLKATVTSEVQQAGKAAVVAAPAPAPADALGKAAQADVSESESSSDSDTDVEKTLAPQKAGGKPLSLSSGQEPIAPKVASGKTAAAGKGGHGGAILKPALAKKALAAPQNDSGLKGTPTTMSPYALLSISPSKGESSRSESEDEATTAAKVPAGPAGGEPEGKKTVGKRKAKGGPGRAPKTPQSGDKENKKQKKPSLKRKLEAEDGGLGATGAPKEKKQKKQSGLETPKKKSKRADGAKKSLGSKEKKKSSKKKKAVKDKKKKSKKSSGLELGADGSSVHKKKKKKVGVDVVPVRQELVAQNGQCPRLPRQRRGPVRLLRVTGETPLLGKG